MLEYKLDVSLFLKNLEEAKEESYDDLFTDDDKLYKRFIEESNMEKLEEFSFEELDCMLFNIYHLSEKYLNVDKGVDSFLSKVKSTKGKIKGGVKWW